MDLENGKEDGERMAPEISPMHHNGNIVLEDKLTHLPGTENWRKNRRTASSGSRGHQAQL